jgi:hypothetical protein
MIEECPAYCLRCIDPKDVNQCVNIVPGTQVKHSYSDVFGYGIIIATNQYWSRAFVTVLWERDRKYSCYYEGDIWDDFEYDYVYHKGCGMTFTQYEYWHDIYDDIDEQLFKRHTLKHKWNVKL